MENYFAFGSLTIGDLVAFIAFVHLLALIVGVLYVLQRVLQDVFNLVALKRCEQCRERVKRAALKCRYCGSSLATETAAPASSLAPYRGDDQPGAGFGG